MKNSTFYFLFSRFQAFLLLSTFYFLFSTSAAYAATLYFYPQKLDLFEGENAVVDVRLNTEGETINALEISGKMDNDKLMITGIDSSNSLLQIFIEKPAYENNTFGFVGGVPKGFNGNDIIGRLNLKAVSEGQVKISFNQPAKILKNSEKGELLAVKLLDAVFNVAKKPEDYITITSRTNPDQNRWYSGKEINLHWNLEKGAGYSYLISSDPAVEPDNIPDKPAGDLEWMGDIKLENLTDGIYYFSLKKIGSNTISRFNIKKDTSSPEWVSALVNTGILETTGKEFLSFLAKDSASGIDYYEVKIDDGNFEQATMPYIINNTNYNNITIRAYDKAGNSADKVITKKVWDYSFWIGAAFLVLLMFSIFVFRQIRSRKNS